MAKICINCGNEIPVMGKSLKLKSRDAEFCKDCAALMKPLFHDLQNNPDRECEEIGEEFDEAVVSLPVRPEIQKYIKKEFDMLYLERYAKNYIVRSFHGTFEDCYKIIKNAVAAAQGIMGVSFDTCILETAGVKTANFLITDYTMMIRDSYTALAVTLVHYQDKATVVTIGSNDTIGNYKKLDRRLWKYIEETNPGLEIQIVRKPERAESNINNE